MKEFVGFVCCGDGRVLCIFQVHSGKKKKNNWKARYSKHSKVKSNRDRSMPNGWVFRNPHLELAVDPMRPLYLVS